MVRLHAKRRLELWCWRGDHEDAVLVVSELVANAVNHARIVGHELRLRLAVTEDGALSVEVSDPVPDFPGFDHALAPGGMDERGRGLAVVRALAAELTWFPRRHIGKTVRARVKP
ncbi:ATP-binding protein [Streptomyces sp. NBC_01136]|uniref:ATP-binding protein n=1 Tax=unclassified Streptomyces TaxID=2593676 RepID=UPI00325361B1|nr:ATP-binding protein [Streptomyces sp. NBC_01136]